MQEGIVTIRFRLITDYIPSDPDTFWFHVGQSIVEGIPDNWFYDTEEILHITQTKIKGIQAGMLENEEEE